VRLDTDTALKAGLIGAAAGLVFGILVGVVPFLFCLFGWIGPLIGLATGALYVHLTVIKESVTEGAVGGAVTGAIASAVSNLASNLLKVILGNGSVSGLIVGVLLGALGGAILGGLGGLIYAAIKKD
jgi:hypothetical protein